MRGQVVDVMRFVEIVIEKNTLRDCFPLFATCEETKQQLLETDCMVLDENAEQHRPLYLLLTDATHSYIKVRRFQIAVQRLRHCRNRIAVETRGGDHLSSERRRSPNLDNTDIHRSEKAQILLLQTQTRIVVFPRAYNHRFVRIHVRYGIHPLQFEFGTKLLLHSPPEGPEWKDSLGLHSKEIGAKRDDCA